ncbi:GTP-binding protein YPT7 [Diplonema papillatum]|nr:GTP-binding protein YPT7 [Diplonema papillatum]
MPQNPEVDLVLLGDSGVGKTALLERFLKGKGDISGPQPTVGAEGRSTVVVLPDGTAADVTLWDCSGQERYMRLSGAGLRGRDGCLLVFEQGRRESFEHVSLWHDEFLQNSAGAAEYLPPCFVLVGNKADGDPSEKQQDPLQQQQQQQRPADVAPLRTVPASCPPAPGEGCSDGTSGVPSDEILSWCSRESIDRRLWRAGLPEGAECPFEKQPVPYFAASAATGDGVRDAFLAAVARAVHRQARLKALHSDPGAYHLNPLDPLDADGAPDGGYTHPQPADDEPADVMVTETIDLKIAVLGDSGTGKSAFLEQVRTGVFREEYRATGAPEISRVRLKVGDKRARIEFCDVPGREKSGPVTSLRGSHVCVVAVAANSKKSLDRALLWREVFMREAAVRDPSSVFCVLLHTKADLDGPSADAPAAAAERLAKLHGWHCVGCNATAHAPAQRALAALAAAAIDNRLQLLCGRIQAQRESADRGREIVAQGKRNVLEQQRKSLYEKYPGATAQAYVEGRVWAGRKGEKDVYIDAPVYPLAVRNLRGEAVDARSSLNVADQLPALFERLTDMRNDMFKAEQRHKVEMDTLSNVNGKQIDALRCELAEMKASLEDEKKRSDELRWELKLVWEALDSR